MKKTRFADTGGMGEKYTPGQKNAITPSWYRLIVYPIPQSSRITPVPTPSPTCCSPSPAVLLCCSDGIRLLPFPYTTKV
jgi:hypothetical protein